MDFRSFVKRASLEQPKAVYVHGFFKIFRFHVIINIFWNNKRLNSKVERVIHDAF